MSLVLNDRVKETTTSIGTGTINLGGAATNFQTFVAGIGDGNFTYYAIVDNTNNAWEVGIGKVTDATPDTLSRDIIKSSSNSGNAVNFSAGTKDVFCTIPCKIPTAPTVRSVSAEATGTGNVTPTLPSGHALNDILFLVVQSSNQSVTAPAGYTQIGPQNGLGTAANAGATRLAVFWKRDGGSESDPTVTDTGDHTYATMIAIKGCVTTGNPFHFKNNGFKKTASTTLTIPGGETTIDNSLIIYFAAHAVDNASAQFSAEANSDLTSITEQFDDGTTDGTGGGIGIWTGIKTTAGVFGNFTATEANSTADIFMCLSMIPNDIFKETSSTSPTEIYNYITSNGGTDTFNIPSNAKGLDIIAIGGGGRGGAGIASTAASGGGGGGR